MSKEQNSVISPRPARFIIFALCTPVISDFQQSARVRTKQKFPARDQQVLSFSHRAHHFLACSAKCTSSVETAFSARDQNVWSFSHLAPYASAIFSKVHEFLQNSLSTLRSARFNFFEESARVCTRQRFQPEISTYFLAKCQVCPKSKTVLLARDQHVLSFSHCEFVQNSVFSRR